MAYSELHAHSSYSFSDGASLPAELAVAAAMHGYESFALTDHDGVWGAMEFAHACRGVGVRPIVGAELEIVAGERPVARAIDAGKALIDSIPPPPRFHLTLLVESAAGWRSLCRLVTLAHADTRTGPASMSGPLPALLELAELERDCEGLVCLTGCAREGLLCGPYERAGGRPRPDALAGRIEIARRLRAAFGPDRLAVELQRPLWRHDRARNRWLAALAERIGVGCVASGNVHSHDRSRAALQDALVAVGRNATLEETEPARRGNGSSALVAPGSMEARFADHPEALAGTERLAERLRFDLTRDLGYRYPGSEDPGADRELAEICDSRFDTRYAGTPEVAEARDRLREELRVIASLRLSGFFRLHFELLELAREVAVEVRGPDSARALMPPGRGRGSSVSSVVCYLTGLSHVDPVRAGLFLGRFLNEEVSEMPDIDLDFPRDIRERLIPRIHERYGHERSALVAAFPTFRTKASVRDFGKALGLPAGEIERVARAASGYGDGRDLERDIVESIGAERARSPRWRALLSLAGEAFGQPRHASQHPGGMVLSTERLHELCPVIPAAMAERQIVQWDKDSCSDAGFLKIDLLGLGMLSAVERCVEDIARCRGERIDLSRIRLDDPEVFEAIQKAETTGVFQIESRAQMQMLPRSLPENLDDIVVQVAIVRPGPIQGGAVHPYLERRKILRTNPDYEIPYEHPSLEPILSDTLGAIVFQDQVIQVAMALAGFSPGEAEGLRRAMSRKRSEEALVAYRRRFVAGALDNGVDREIAERVFSQVEGFSGFGFPKSHSAAFGLLAYQSTWLRVHYAAEFLAALLNEQPMGFYPPDALVHEAQRRGVEVRGVDVNRSEVACTAEPAVERGAPPAVRVGLGYVGGLREAEAERLVRARRDGGEFTELGELASRSGLRRESLERLAWSGAFAPLGVPAGKGSRGHLRQVAPPGDSRRRALWSAGVAAGSRRAGSDGLQLALPLELPEAPELEPVSPWESMIADYKSTSMTLGEHPMSLIRAELGPGMLTSTELERARNMSSVRTAGLVVARQRPGTAKGVVFMLLEDEVGVVNVIVPPPVYERCRLTVRTSPLVSCSGRIERREGVMNLIADEVSQLSSPGISGAEVRTIEPSVEAETGRVPTDRVAAAGGAAGLAAVAPRPQSFGRRG
ncbi:error-prone DNA polymerase [Thermoleophilia bacterium SCSIO 60948]|nr:error-prone DNA polymerase [Thermoleophilia bacterium SCSIO 60948]